MNPIKCPKCKGKGYVAPVDPLLAVFSLGLTYLLDKSDRKTCSGCDGKGWVK